MIEKFSKWIYSRPSEDTIIDVMAQLLNFVCEGKGCIAPEHISVDVSESESGCHAELIFEENIWEFDEKFSPLTIEVIAVENVFVAGLIFYILLTGNDPDTSKGKDLLNAMDTYRPHPLLSIEGSPFNDFIEKMTEVDTEKRARPEDLLNELTSRYNGVAVIRLVESDSNAEIDQKSVILNSPVTVWKSPDEFNYGGQRFFPKEQKEISIPFRMFSVEYDFPVTTRDTSAEIIYSVTGNSGTRYFGFDIGEYSVKVSCLDEYGKVTDLDDSIRSCAAFDAGGRCLYGDEAVKLCKETDAEPINVFCSELAADTQFNVVDENGNTFVKSSEEIVGGFFRYLKSVISKKLIYDGMRSVNAITLPIGCSGKRKEFILSMAEKNGFRKLIASAASAQALSFFAENDQNKRIMTVNAGGSCTEIKVFKGHGRITNEGVSDLAEMTTEGVSADGGNSMTMVIYDCLIQKLNSYYGINMYTVEASGLPQAHYDANRKTLMKLSEKMKRVLSFKEKASEKTELYGMDMQKTEVNLSVVRREYENYLISLLGKVKAAIDEALSKEHCHKSDIGCIVLSGGASITPAFIKLLEDHFIGTNCKIIRSYNSTALSRGAALYCCLKSKVTVAEKAASTINKDIGTVTVDMAKGVPSFNRYIEADTEYDNGKVLFSMEHEPSPKEKESNFCEIKLYTREKGMEHVTSTYEGDAIKYIGKFRIELPQNLNIESEKIKLDIEIDTKWNITAKAVILKKVGAFGSFMKKLKKENTSGWEPSDKKVSVEFYGV